jgi:hypothetical protein
MNEVELSTPLMAARHTHIDEHITGGTCIFNRNALRGYVFSEILTSSTILNDQPRSIGLRAPLRHVEARRMIWVYLRPLLSTPLGPSRAHKGTIIRPHPSMS